MKTFFLCLLSASTAAAHLLRSNQQDRELIVESEDEVVSKSYLTDDYSTQYSTYSTDSSYADTIAVFDVCTSIEAREVTYFMSDHLTDFCYKLGPNLGSLCFEDTDCGGTYSCSSKASDVAKEQVSVSLAKRWGTFFIYEDKSSTVTYSNVFHCYDPANPDGSDRSGGGSSKSTPCTSTCADCARPEHSCTYDADCEGTSECVHNSDIGLKFCALGENKLESGTCCTSNVGTALCAEGLLCDAYSGQWATNNLPYFACGDPTQ